MDQKSNAPFAPSFNSEDDEVATELFTDDGRNLAAVMLGRRGGLKGGKARAAKLSSEERSRIAKLAAQARWNKGE